MNWYDKIAPYYDYLNQNKNYAGDVAFIEYIINKYSLNVAEILDIGCGTGTHAKLLSEKDYKVTGIDNSKKLINEAIKKNPRLIFIIKDMKRFNLNKEFDMIICMYGTIHYIKSKRRLKKTLKKFYKHLKHSGALILEVDLIKDSFDPDASDVQNFDLGEIEGSIIKEYEEKNGKILFSYNVNIRDNDKIIRAIDTRKAPLLSIREWKKTLKNAGFKVLIEYNDKRPVLVGLKI